MTAAARMMRAARVSSQPRAASTCAVMPTLVATMAAPDEDALDLRLAGERGDSPSHEETAGRSRRRRPGERCRQPCINSEDLISRPTRKRRNITPRSERAWRNSLGASHPRTCGPIRTPARISPTMPGCPRRSKSSAISFADAKTNSMEKGMSAAGVINFIMRCGQAPQVRLCSARTGPSLTVGARMTSLILHDFESEPRPLGAV